MDIIIESSIGILSQLWTITANFFDANSIWINGILLFYALILSIGWRNYQVVRLHLMDSIVEQFNTKISTSNSSEIDRKLNAIVIPWETAKAKLWIPVIAKAGSLIPVIASLETIRKLFPRAELIQVIRELVNQEGQ